MRRKSFYYVSMFAFAAAVIIFQPTALYDGTGVSRSGRSRMAAYFNNTADEGDSPYYVRCALSRFPAGNINCYLPQYIPMEQQTALLYASMFNLPEDCAEEDEEAYRFTGEEGTLSVYKYARQLHYEAALPLSVRHAGKTDSAMDRPDAPTISDIIAQAACFFEERLLFLPYEETRVAFDGEQYTVTFVDRIGNIKNYAFNNTVVTDRQGNILQADYFFIQYDKLSACKIKSMQEAFEELPRDMPDDRYVSLTDCTLVYTYENSIVQPAYFFTGEVSGGQTFEYFVKAAVYGT